MKLIAPALIAMMLIGIVGSASAYGRWHHHHHHRHHHHSGISIHL